MRLFVPALCACLSRKCAVPQSFRHRRAASRRLLRRRPVTRHPAAERSRALDRLFDEYWQYVLKTSPETATYLGDLTL